jgi:hypothetical protein
VLVETGSFSLGLVRLSVGPDSPEDSHSSTNADGGTGDASDRQEEFKSLSLSLLHKMDF